MSSSHSRIAKIDGMSLGPDNVGDQLANRNVAFRSRGDVYCHHKRWINRGITQG